MKTLRVSDDAHQKLTALLGELMAQKRMMQTYTDAIEALLNQSVILPTKLLKEVEKIINEKPELGYTTKEEFIRDAIRRRIDEITGEIEWIGIDKEKYEKAREALQELNWAWSIADYIEDQLDHLLEEYEKYKEAQKEIEKQYEEDY